MIGKTRFCDRRRYARSYVILLPLKKMVKKKIHAISNFHFSETIFKAITVPIKDYFISSIHLHCINLDSEEKSM